MGIHALLLNIFSYQDYRAYLKDVYSARRKRGLSHRGLARRAGLSSPSFLKAVMDGQKNLAPATAPGSKNLLAYTAAEFMQELNGTPLAKCFAPLITSGAFFSQQNVKW